MEYGGSTPYSKLKAYPQPELRRSGTPVPVGIDGRTALTLFADRAGAENLIKFSLHPDLVCVFTRSTHGDRPMRRTTSA
jgi:hypothetical protein